MAHHKQENLSSVLVAAGANRLLILEVGTVGHHLSNLEESGRSDQTVNAHRATTVALRAERKVMPRDPVGPLSAGKARIAAKSASIRWLIISTPGIPRYQAGLTRNSYRRLLKRIAMSIMAVERSRL